MMKRQAGFSFIEIIVSLIIVSGMVLSLNVMHVTALQQAKDACYFSIALQQLHVMSEFLDSNRSLDITKQVSAWNKLNAEVLPQGKGVIIGVSPFINLAIFWGGASELTCKENKIGKSGCIFI